MHLPYTVEPLNKNIKSDWISKSDMLVEENSSTTNSSTASPPKSQSNGNEFWWTERMVLRAQEEFPNELGINAVKMFEKEFTKPSKFQFEPVARIFYAPRCPITGDPIKRFPSLLKSLHWVMFPITLLCRSERETTKIITAS